MATLSFEIFGFHLQLSFYGLMYSFGFLGGYWILLRRKFLSEPLLDALMITMFFGVVLGGRFGYILFYNLPYYLDNPSEILQFWKGGMSFHGGVLGVLIALAVYAKKYSISYLKVTDGITSILPLGIGLGRIGNYVNNELPGYINYTGPFAMNIQGMPHFPSPLLESLLEGGITGIILYFVVKGSPRPGITSCIFLICYTLARCTSEFFRLPDAHIGYIIPGISLGMILTIPLGIFGIIYGAILLQGNTPSSSSSGAS